MTLTRDGHVTCDWCGRFISIEDLVEGRATHDLVTPDSDRSVEEYESRCAECIKRRREE